MKLKSEIDFWDKKDLFLVLAKDVEQAALMLYPISTSRQRKHQAVSLGRYSAVLQDQTKLARF